MISRARKKFFAGVIGVATVAAVCTAVNAASAAPAPAGADEATPPSAVETFEYPNAAKILKDRGIILRKGDGHIVLADCNVSRDIVVNSTALDNVDRGRYCFKVTGTGKSGYLALEIPKVVTIGAGDYAVEAKVTADSQTTKVEVPKNDMASVGQGSSRPGGAAVLVELRVTA
ncbi:hypothetical protein ABZ545_14775 [Streptomyces abikoensis]|uniref:hypothetical protein n=1 Tax=Streptomyces abikoensis TaxID=97398 RepID=UPI0033E52AB2